MTQYHPEPLPPFTEDEARDWLAWAHETQDEMVQRVYEAYNRQAHLALGYGSWAEMCEGEGLGFYRLPRDKRAPAVVQLKTHGLSNRAIGSALGVDERTVRNDIRETHGHTSEEPRSNGADNSALNDQELTDRQRQKLQDIIRALRKVRIWLNGIGLVDTRDEVNVIIRELESM